MMIYVHLITGVLISYLIGSIPTAYIFVRLLKGIDIRKIGSGNVGATNALRVLGKGWGITVLLLDILKGFLCVTLLADILISRSLPVSPDLLRIVLGIVCIIGHSWTVFLKFKGGKGVASTLGVFVGLSVHISALKIVLALALFTWLGVFLLSRIVSLASIVTCIFFPFYIMLFTQSGMLILVSALLSAFIILRHKANLVRLIQGKEHRISFKK